MDKNTVCKCDCKCSNTSCSRHSDCKACVAYHKKVGSRTACGKTGDESYSDD